MSDNASTFHLQSSTRTFASSSQIAYCIVLCDDDIAYCIALCDDDVLMLMSDNASSTFHLSATNIHEFRRSLTVLVTVMMTCGC
ncbi:hypothetical protein J6590_061450 [Homalodisca vitripennis]|nr:hypothetical protein J6590_061450 [Homalodisca vitripennis]